MPPMVRTVDPWEAEMKRIKRHGCLAAIHLIALFIIIFIAFSPVSAGDCPGKTQNRDCELKSLREELKTLQEKIEKLEKKSAWAEDDIEDLSARVDKTEMHTATDKIAFDVYFRTEAGSLHYDDVRIAPQPLMAAFFTPVPNGFNGATLSRIQQAMGQMAMNGMVPPPDAYDADNDIIYTNKLRLDMKSVLSPNLSFQGRLAAYKVFGDSTGVKFNQGSLGDVAFDGNTSSLPHGDTVHMERAYFVYKDEMGKLPWNLSIGRRPSTDGPPLEYGEYSLVGGSPAATIINWQFDGASLTFGLEDLTGIPGASFKLCYGVGFEANWGNAASLNYMASDIEDVHMFGFISDFYNNGNSSLIFNYAHAWDITDGFTGTTVMPFIVKKQDTDGDGAAEYYFEENSGGFISRIAPMTNIGDWDAASLLFSTNLAEKFADIDLFLAGSWTHTDPSRISKNPFYEIMGMGLLSTNGDLESHDGYSIYCGAIFPMPWEGRLGLEYNWGSKYWFSFTGAEDSLVGSKLAARGEVYEAYYIQPILQKKFFAKLGAQFYDYTYTGSGNPLGEPVRISCLTGLDAVNPVVDQVWNYYLSATVNF